jgi:hypothetical protein
MKCDTLIALAYTGDHYKMREGYVPQIPHQQMLLEAINNVNPDSEFDVLVSANRFSVMDIVNDEERYHAWPIYRLADAVISMRDNCGHQAGQAWAIRAAVEYAKTKGYTTLFWSAEDILFDDPFMVKDSVKRMRDAGAKYVGRHWGNDAELDCQVFAADVKTLFNLFKPHDFVARGGLIESYMNDVLKGVPKLIHVMHHHHEHSPDKFLALLPHVAALHRQGRLQNPYL